MTLLAALVVLLLAARYQRLIGSSIDTARGARLDRWFTAAVLLLSMLLLLNQPEARALLLLSEAIGLDLMALLLLIQLRYLGGLLLLTITRWLDRFYEYSPLPYLKPSRALLRADPALGLMAAAWPVSCIAFAASALLASGLRSR